MKCSNYIAKKLSKYTNCAFTGQGGSVVHILDSLSKLKNFRIIPSQNEQGASLAADAYTRCSNKIGLVIATSGPGIINTLQGMACSYYDSIPGLYISGAPTKAMLKKSANLRQLGFQEMDVVNIVKTFTKYATRITNLNKVDYEIEKCIHIAMEGRPGPCLIDLPDDIQRSEINLSKQKKYFYKKLMNNNKINFEKFNKFFKDSKKPLLILGNGVKQSKTSESILKIIKKKNIPFTTTWAATGLFPSLSNLNVGSFGVYATRHGNLAVNNCDLLIVMGSRLSGTLIGTDPKKFAPNAKKIHIDIDPEELKGENRVNINLKINMNLKKFLKNNPFDKVKVNVDPAWPKQIKEWKQKFPVVKKAFYLEKKYVNPYVFFRSLEKKLKPKDILISDASANLVWTYQSLSEKFNTQIFTSLNASPMGYLVAASIGASIAEPKKNIIAIIGDGSMQMNIQEIENISSMKLPIKIILINNSGYGMMKQTIDTWLDSNYVGCDKGSGLTLPNFKKVFKAYGISSVSINYNKDIDKVLKKVINSKKSVLCEVKVDPSAKIIPKVKPGYPLHEMLTKI